MTRTNNELDEFAMRRYRLDSKQEVDRFAREQLVGVAMTRAEVLTMQGTGFEFSNDEIKAFSNAHAISTRPVTDTR